MTIKIKLIEPPALKLLMRTAVGEQFNLPTLRTHYPKIQLQILSSALKVLPNADVEVIDMKTLGDKEELYKEISYGGSKIACLRVGAGFSDLESKISDADVIGISSPFTQAAQIVADLGRHIKKLNPHCELIVGGFDTVTKEREEFYLRNYFDLVIPVDGEVNLPNYLIKKYNLNSPLRSFPNDAILVHEKNTAAKLSLPLPDLDSIDVKLFTETEDGKLPFGANLPIGYFVSSKGCDNSCGFCTIPQINGRYRIMSIEDIETLLLHYKKHGITTLLHSESNTLGRLRYGQEGRKQLFDMFRMMRELGFAWEFFDGIEFGLLSRQGSIDEELVSALFNPELKRERLVGGYRAYIPLEDFHSSATSRYKKLPDYETQIAVIRSIIHSSVKMLSFGAIIGYPEETAQSLERRGCEMLKLKEFVDKESGGQTSALFILYLHSTFPGTLDFARYRKDLAYDINKFPELFQLYTACKPSAGFSPLQLTLERRKGDYRLNGAEICRQMDKTGRPPYFY
jgi:radical SAM superfamily enzyme YgiQ (UPF0313 family)